MLCICKGWGWSRENRPSKRPYFRPTPPSKRNKNCETVTRTKVRKLKNEPGRERSRKKLLVCFARKKKLNLLFVSVENTNMVFNSLIVLWVANRSADVWQYVACIPDRISSQQLLDLICCFPLQQFGRLALCLWTFFCLPPSDYYYHTSSSSSDSSSSAPDYDYYYDSHSDWTVNLSVTRRSCIVIPNPFLLLLLLFFNM